MGAGLTRQRVRIGRDVRVVTERPEGLELEGRTRLAPGRPVDLVLPSPADAAAGVVKPAVVWSWYVVRVGPAGATYRGICRWSVGVTA
jgi:hypothetical protein